MSVWFSPGQTWVLAAGGKMVGLEIGVAAGDLFRSFAGTGCRVGQSEYLVSP